MWVIDMGTSPVRTCIGCRQTSPRTELVRLVLIEGQPTVDPRRRLPGRGASVHPTEVCVNAAVRQGGFARAFRRRVVVVSPVDLSNRVTAAFGSWRDGNGNPE